MKKSNNLNIKKLRQTIDTIDLNIINELHKRISIIEKIKHYKTLNKDHIFASEREIAILERLFKQNKDIFPSESLLKIYNEIFSASRKIEMPLKIGYLGPEGTFTHQAAENIFGSSSEYFPLNSFRDIFSETENNQIHYGVIPIENSNAGMVPYTLDLLIEYNLYIIQESFLRVTQNLLSKEKSINKIKYLYSMSEPLSQCHIFLENTLKNVKYIDASSTSEAARIVRHKRHAAAIASKAVSEKYKLNILAENINDNLNNYTRFFVIAQNPNKIKAKTTYKTSLIVGIKDKPGALISLLTPLDKHKVNMTKIESRPTKKKAWEYIFFIEFVGSLNDRKVKKALHEMEPHCTYLKALGSYPIYKFNI